MLCTVCSVVRGELGTQKLHVLWHLPGRVQWGREEDESKEEERLRTRTNAPDAGFMAFQVELVLLRLHESVRPLHSHPFENLLSASTWSQEWG